MPTCSSSAISLQRTNRGSLHLCGADGANIKESRDPELLDCRATSLARSIQESATEASGTTSGLSGDWSLNERAKIPLMPVSKRARQAESTHSCGLRDGIVNMLRTVVTP